MDTDPYSGPERRRCERCGVGRIVGTDETGPTPVRLCWLCLNDFDKEHARTPESRDENPHPVDTYGNGGGA